MQKGKKKGNYQIKQAPGNRADENEKSKVVLKNTFNLIRIAKLNDHAIFV